MRTKILLALLVGMMGAGAQAPPTQVVEMSAERFAFTPSEVKTRVGTRLEFRITSDDTIHGFRLVDTEINVEIPKRGKGKATVVFVPTEPGTYTFECSHTCGAGHSFMRGRVVVTK
jgi:cytochrome c oxidase subunit 2